jgi:hypothetical protein
MLSAKLEHIASALAERAQHGPVEPTTIEMVASHLRALLDDCKQLERAVIPAVHVSGPIDCAEAGAISRLFLAGRCTLNDGQMRLIAAAALIHVDREHRRACPDCTARQRGA